MKKRQSKVISVVLALALVFAMSTVAFAASDADDAIGEVIAVSSPDEATPDETTPDETTPDEPTTEVPSSPDEPTPVDKVLGDVDGDGELTVKDAAQIQLFKARLLAEDAVFDESVADYDCNGAVNILDAARIQLVIAKLAKPVNPASPDQPATEPTTGATEPTTGATEPTTGATEPTTGATEPTTGATEPTTGAAEPEGSDYYITGAPELTGGPVDWVPNFLALDKNDNGTYTTTFSGIPEGSYTFKITNGTWDVQWGKGGVKDPMVDNYSITLSEEADVTVTFDPSKDSNAITVTTDPENALSSFVLKSITAVGNGEGAWLNGANWAPGDLTNVMTEVESGIYTITYEGVDDYNQYNLKFACNGSWTVNWGVGTEVVSQDEDTVTVKAVYNMNDPQTNLTVDAPGTTVTLTIDVRGFDFDTNSGDVFVTMQGIHITQ